jgi:hypothetical protein
MNRFYIIHKKRRSSNHANHALQESSPTHKIKAHSPQPKIDLSLPPIKEHIHERFPPQKKEQIRAIRKNIFEFGLYICGSETSVHNDNKSKFLPSSPLRINRENISFPSYLKQKRTYGGNIGLLDGFSILSSCKHSNKGFQSKKESDIISRIIYKRNKSLLPSQTMNNRSRTIAAEKQKLVIQKSVDIPHNYKAERCNKKNEADILRPWTRGSMNGIEV